MRKSMQFPVGFMVLLAIVLTVSSTQAQDDKANRPSPPAEATGTVEGTDITINYSQPAVKGREIFGELVPYGEVWRTGANEATTFEVSNDVTINGEVLPAGKYALFTIPRKNEDWTVIFNKNPDQWGAFDYDESQDALKMAVTPEETEETAERVTFEVGEEGEVSMMWANTAISFDVASAGQASN